MSAHLIPPWGSSSAWLLNLLLVVNGGLFLVLLPASVNAQNNASTTKHEVKAFNEIFTKWNIMSIIKWNSTEDPCSGVALGDSVIIDDVTYSPFIKCDCTYNNSTTCHITALKVYNLDVTGEIPDVLWNLTYLTNLNLGLNYLTGSLSPSIGNLRNMQWLSFGINALSGPIPKEIGLLTHLKSLGISSNNFSGPVPSEIGNINGLQQLYLDSSGLIGKIPSTFANLVNLQIFWASDAELNGTIPDFIGSWTQLTELRLEGNEFVGSIPSSFSNLTALQTLRIGDLSNGTSSLAFITKLTSLITLVLRNIKFSDSIPTGIGGLRKLNYLDLSFNNIAGKIPDSLFSLNLLTYLFLGNNKLTGSLPSRKSSSLKNIDVSYNQLSGNIPSWVTSKLQLNLVANNFTSISNSALPSGSNCLQNDFPCFLGSPRYSSFAVKCGGPQITSSDGTVFEKENEVIGPATYYVPGANRWGVSNAGYFLGSNNASFVASSSRQFSTTLDSELFQTSRLSPGSLRYYGLGLENGNYTVTLQFAELVIPNGKTWRSLGRRVFDIYLQGNLALKNFDIQKAAGGSSFSVVKTNFTARVTANHLEIHLMWAGKGTCCVPSQGTYGPSVSAISITPNFVPTVSNKPPSNNDNNKTGLILAIVLPVGCLCLLFLAVCYVFQKKRRLRAAQDEELMGVEYKPYLFSYSEVKTATEDFNSSHKLGEGGFGPVFKGTLSDGRVVAVKQLSFKSRQGKTQFVAEIATISAVQHRNLVKLYGCCLEGEKRLLVYEYLENGSLDQALFGKGGVALNWAKRFEICMGVAKGISYLHEESRLRIVHRDVKASNILLDSELSPKISDFGLAKLYNDKETHVSTGVAGTIGYLAPEYAMRGHLTEKVDVFSFGVLALEIVSGRSNSDSSLSKEKMYLLEWTWQLYEGDQELDLVDEKLEGEFDKEDVKRIIRVGLLCTQTAHAHRPSMSRVVAMLSGDVEVGDIPARPGYLTDWRYDDASFQSNTVSSFGGGVYSGTTITRSTLFSPEADDSRPLTTK